MDEVKLEQNGVGLKPGFSIVIPVYNGEKYLPDTLRSISGLEGGPYELIVVDDASTDKTADLARSAGARVIQLKSNQGPASARNVGARHTMHEVIVFTDSDVLLPKRLLIMLAQHFQKPSIHAVQGVFSEVCPFGNYFSQYKNLYNRYVLLMLPEWIDTTFTSITAVRRDAFINSGGFDENIKTASVEDRTLGRNLRKKGYNIKLDRTIEVVHNKKLTFWGFIRNQYTRSRDLIKLMLRNRGEPAIPMEEERTAVEERARFGTNSLNTMLRIPVAYLAMLFLLLALIDKIFLLPVVIFLLFYLYLIFPFEIYLFRQRSSAFAWKGIWANFLDAIVSGLGIFFGMVEYYLLGKKY